MIRMCGGRFAATLAGCLALVALPSSGLAVLDYDLSLGGNVSRTDNLHLDAEPQEEGQREPVEEMIYGVAPGVQLDWREGRDNLVSSYFGQYLTFSGDEDRDPEWIHRLSASLGWRRWEPFFLESGATYQRVPRTEGDQNESIVDQIDQASLLLRTGFTWPVGATGTAELAYRGEFESFSGGGEDEDDRIARNYAEAVFRRRWGPLWDGEVSARYGLVSQHLEADSTEAIIAAALNRRLSERLRAGVNVEWVRQEYDAADSDGVDGDGESEGATGTHTNFLASAELRRDLDRGGFWSLSYANRLEAQPDGDTLTVGRAAAVGSLHSRLGSEIGATVWHEDRNFRVSENDETAWGPTVTARWMIAPWVALDLGGSWEKTTTKEPEADDIEDRTTRVGAGLVFLLGRQWVAEAGYVYRENDSDTDVDSYTSNLFSAGLSYHFKVIPPGRIPASTIVGLAFSDQMIPAGR